MPSAAASHFILAPRDRESPNGKARLAAKITHVPSLMLSEVAGSPLKSARENAVRAPRELAGAASERKATIFVVFDMHWLSNSGDHINANPHHRVRSRSDEALDNTQDLCHDLPGNTALAEAIAAEAREAGST